MNILESAKTIGALRAVELACFERLGERAPLLSPPSCARWAAAASLAHAWRASQLEELLPVSVGLPSLDEVTVLPDGPLGAELDLTLPALGDAVRLAGDARPSESAGEAAEAGDARAFVAELSSRLYGQLLAEYSRRLEVSSPASDGAVLRTLGRVVADLEVVRAEGFAIGLGPL